MEMRMLRQISTWLVVHLIVNGTLVSALHDLRIRVPRAVPVGGVATLHCAWTLDRDEALYAVKWYRGGREFYRYIPKELPHTTVFPVEGINVDISNSDAHRVRLVRVSHDLSGRFRCEVSADAPSFHTEVRAAYMRVVTLPASGPRLGARRRAAQAGRALRVVCEAPPSDPPTNITWLVNGEQVKGGGTIHEFDGDIKDWDWSTAKFAPKISFEEDNPHQSQSFIFGESDVNASDFPQNYPGFSQDMAEEVEYNLNVESNSHVFQNLPSYPEPKDERKLDNTIEVSREYLGSSSQLTATQSLEVPKWASDVNRPLDLGLQRFRRSIDQIKIRFSTAYLKASKFRRRNASRNNLDRIQNRGIESNCTKLTESSKERADISRGSQERNIRKGKTFRSWYSSNIRGRRSAKLNIRKQTPENIGKGLLPSVSFLTLVVPTAAFATGPLRVSCVANIFSVFEGRAEMKFEEEDPLIAPVLGARNRSSGCELWSWWGYMLVFMLTVLLPQ